MAANDKVEVTGVVIKALRGSLFEVAIDDTNVVAKCKPAGRLRANNIRILQGDHVTVQLSTYDLTNGIITWRDK